MNHSVLLGVALAMAIAIPGQAQRRQPSASVLLQQVQVSESVSPAEAAPGDTVVLGLSIRPDRGLRVFAPGAKEYTPVVALLSAARGVAVGPPRYSAPIVEENPGNRKRVPLYARAFDITYAARIDKGAKPGTYIRVSGTLTYQACDDRRVFPKRTLLVHWTVKVVAPNDTER